MALPKRKRKKNSLTIKWQRFFRRYFWEFCPQTKLQQKNFLKHAFEEKCLKSSKQGGKLQTSLFLKDIKESLNKWRDVWENEIRRFNIVEMLCWSPSQHIVLIQFNQNSVRFFWTFGHFFKIFIYLAMPCLSYSMQDLWPLLQHVASNFFFSCSRQTLSCGIEDPDQGSNLTPLHWEHGVLDTGHQKSCVTNF